MLSIRINAGQGGRIGTLAARRDQLAGGVLRRPKSWAAIPGSSPAFLKACLLMYSTGVEKATGRANSCPLAFTRLPPRNSEESLAASSGTFASLITWCSGLRKLALSARNRAYSSLVTRLSCFGASPSARPDHLHLHVLALLVEV